MGIRGLTIDWNQIRLVDQYLAQAQDQQLPYLIFASRPDAVVEAALTPSADLVVARDAFGTDTWSELSRGLPAQLYFVAVRPSDHLAVAVATKTLSSHLRIVEESHSLDELVVRLSAVVTPSFVENVPSTSASHFEYPGLTMADDNAGTADEWRREIVQQVSTTRFKASTAVTALQAGLLLFGGFFDDSHGCSQSIEGLSPHTGDYWHAILHRREPDYGNAKYWFRHVGQYPTFSELGDLVRQKLDAATGSLASTLQGWKTRLIVRGRWDSLAFVDLCAAAENDSELRRWCEQVQYTEMRLLLISSAQAVTGR